MIIYRNVCCMICSVQKMRKNGSTSKKRMIVQTILSRLHYAYSNMRFPFCKKRCSSFDYISSKLLVWFSKNPTVVMAFSTSSILNYVWKQIDAGTQFWRIYEVILSYDLNLWFSHIFSFYFNLKSWAANGNVEFLPCWLCYFSLVAFSFLFFYYLGCTSRVNTLILTVNLILLHILSQ